LITHSNWLKVYFTTIYMLGIGIVVYKISTAHLSKCQRLLLKQEQTLFYF